MAFRLGKRVHSMIDLKQTLIDIVKAIVDEPAEVQVKMDEQDDEVLLELNVAPDDIGKVIGRHGKIAKAIRTIMKAAANSNGKKVTVEIR